MDNESIIASLRNKRVVSFDLSENKENLVVIEMCDENFLDNLSKQEVKRLIKELKVIESEMIDESTVFRQIIETYNFESTGKGDVFQKEYDSGYIFLSPLSDNRTIRVSVGQQTDCIHFHDEVDLFEFKEFSEFESFIDIINLKTDET